MSKTYDTLEPDLIDWITAQHLFFVATAPIHGGHVNCSPKGLDSFRILDPLAVAYLDFTGSGIETLAHLQDNGRIVLMFCAFEGAPKIVRIHGRGTPIEVGDPRFTEMIQHFMPLDGSLRASTRAVILVDVERIADSCGYGVPLMQYVSDRPQIPLWVDNRLRTRGPDALVQYQREKNLASIDELPGLDPTLQSHPLQPEQVS